MKRDDVIFFVVGLALLLTFTTAFGQEKAEKKHKYIGSAKCKICHNVAAKGAQYKKWKEGLHSKAFEVLASEKALEVGKKLGVDNPQTSEKCLSCHVTAFGVAAELKEASFDQTEGVGCEACHGPGSDYRKMKVMKDREASSAAGLILPDEKTCLKCHNEKSPTYKEFVFEEAFKIIAHPNPKRQAEKPAEK